MAKVDMELNVFAVAYISGILMAVKNMSQWKVLDQHTLYLGIPHQAVPDFQPGEEVEIKIVCEVVE
jgi:hypothetical protein